MDYGPFGVRFLFFNTKKERRSIDELLIYFATPPLLFNTLPHWIIPVLLQLPTES